MTVASPTLQTPAHAGRSASGRLRQDGLSDTDRNMAMCMHLSALVCAVLGAGVLGLVAPLALWLVRRKDSVFDDDHGREVINFTLSFLLWNLICVVTVIGILFVPVLWIVAIVNTIRGAVAAHHSEYFRYPMTIRLLS